MVMQHLSGGGRGLFSSPDSILANSLPSPLAASVLPLEVATHVFEISRALLDAGFSTYGGSGVVAADLTVGARDVFLKQASELGLALLGSRFVAECRWGILERVQCAGWRMDLPCF